MQVIDLINNALKERRTLFTFELLPPLKGDGTDGIFGAIDTLAEFDPAYINVTSHREDVVYVETAGGLHEKRVVRRRPGTVGISAAIMRRYGIPVVPHIICGGVSRYDTEDALIDLDFLGIDNVLALRGDNLRGENAFVPHPRGHCNAAGLVRQIADMNRGVFIDGPVDTGHRSHFCVGVAGYPEKHAESPNPESDIRRLKEKVDAGASYIVTQMSFDNRRIFDFIDRCRAAGITVPIVPGIKPFAAPGQLAALPRIFHVDLPADLVREVDRCGDPRDIRRVGVEWAIAQAAELKRVGLPVLHFYTMGKTDNVAAIVKAVF